jgi:hypothetical protein
MLFQWDSCIEFLNESALASEKLFLGDSGIEFVNGLLRESEKLFRGESEFRNDCPLTILALAALGAFVLAK